MPGSVWGQKLAFRADSGYSYGMNNAFHIEKCRPASLEYRIETPENVELVYQLAGPAVRLKAFLLDLLFRAILIVILLISLNFFGVLILSRGVVSGVLLIALFLVEWFYFAFFEGLTGQTPGKAMFGLRVIHAAGHPVSRWATVLRNFVRAIDCQPGWGPFGFYGIAWLSMLSTGRFQRLGDLAAQTIVVQERKVRLPREPIILAKIEKLSKTEIGTWVPPAQTLALIEEFLSRRGVLTYGQGHSMVAEFAVLMANRLGYSGPPEFVQNYPMAFLAKVYATFHREEEEEADGLAGFSEKQLEIRHSQGRVLATLSHRSSSMEGAAQIGAKSAEAGSWSAGSEIGKYVTVADEVAVEQPRGRLPREGVIEELDLGKDAAVGRVLDYSAGQPTNERAANSEEQPEETGGGA